MPLYEYRCKPCDREFELLRPMEFSNKTAGCPSCGKPSSRILSVFAATTRGSSGSEPVAGTSGGGCGGGSCCGGSCASMN